MELTKNSYFSVVLDRTLEPFLILLNNNNQKPSLSEDVNEATAFYDILKDVIDKYKTNIRAIHFTCSKRRSKKKNIHSSHFHVKILMN